MGDHEIPYIIIYTYIPKVISLRINQVDEQISQAYSTNASLNQFTLLQYVLLQVWLKMIKVKYYKNHIFKLLRQPTTHMQELVIISKMNDQKFSAKPLLVVYL